MLSGYAGVTYEIAGQYNPPLPPSANEDPGNGMLGAVAIMLALLHRDRTGCGQSVENPQLNATMGHLAHIVRTVDGEIIGAGRLDPLQMGVDPFDRLYETGEGWVCVVAPTAEEQRALLETLGVDAVDDDELQSDRLRAAFARLEHRRRGPASARRGRRRRGAGGAQHARVHERPGGSAAPGASPSCRTRNWATSGSSTCSCA